MSFRDRMTGHRFARKVCLRRAGWRAAMLGLAVVGFSSMFAADSTQGSDLRDARAAKLFAFFAAHRCPVPLHVGDYLRVADAYAIDYRLLPALSVRESTCGRHQRLNNRWGWDSARTGFESVARGIEFVARQLAEGRSYRGKTLEEKLHTYNPNPQYPGEIKRLMQEIDAD